MLAHRTTLSAVAALRACAPKKKGLKKKKERIESMPDSACLDDFEHFQELVHQLLELHERADVLLRVPSRSLSFQGQLKLHDHGQLMFR
jgi:hypothetical protein